MGGLLFIADSENKKQQFSLCPKRGKKIGNAILKTDHAFERNKSY